MQGVSSVAQATVLGFRPTSDKDLGGLLKADTLLQRQQQSVILDKLREAGLTTRDSASPKRSAAEVQRTQDKLAKWARALQRLVAGPGAQGHRHGKDGHGQATASVLIAGRATSTTGVAVTLQADRVDGVYTDWKAGLGPREFYNDAALADTVSILANRVEQVVTAGGADAVSITAGRVRGIYTGNDQDSLSIVAHVVQAIHTDEEVAGGRDAADALAIAARLVEGVWTGGGNDAVAIVAETVAGVSGGGGDDAISVLANVVAGISGGDGNDTMAIDTQVGRRDDLFDEFSLARNPYTPTDLMARMVLVTGLQAQVDGGAGADALSIKVAGTIGVTGGSGDDAIALQGGTVGLFYALGDGSDAVTLAPGTEAVVQITGAEGYTAEWGEDTLTLRIGEGSITFAGLSQSGAIGVQLGAGMGVVVLHPGQAALDRLA